MTEATALAPFHPVQTSEDVITEIIGGGARRLLAAALEAEVEAEVETHLADVRDERSRRAVVRNRYLPEREVMTGIGPVPVQQPVHVRPPGVESPRPSRVGALPQDARRRRGDSWMVFLTSGSCRHRGQQSSTQAASPGNPLTRSRRGKQLPLSADLVPGSRPSGALGCRLPDTPVVLVGFCRLLLVTVRRTPSGARRGFLDDGAHGPPMARGPEAAMDRARGA